ncbi:hypothetical protein CWI38_1708p0010 [Hamiltosporidium tvaerminnensis]|uniref:Reverse transcriptase n=1 Tax=Hamiltosporidium tvaerminnensis TaxID=1176355 RepID=A0A4Q9LPU9_9MICR|nr:hypothetical protein CWI38_1708p0010 [Hamiltosporidium tvaerminnensis]
MGRKKNVSSEISKNTKIKAANDAGEVKKSDSEVQKCKLHPPAISLHSSSYTTITPPPPSQTCSKMQNSGLDTLPSPNAPVPSSVEVSACEPSYDMTSSCKRLMALRTIFDSVTADPKEWPRIVFFAVQTRFERMPRNGWTELHRYYNEKFGCTETLQVLKKLAQSEMEKELKSEENGERRRIATCLTESCTLTDTTEYINLRDKFLSKIKQISQKEIGKVVVRTRKHPNELVDSKVLDLINRVVGEYAGAHVPESITEAAYIMQAAQKENIESKISKLVLSKDLLEKACKQEKLSTSGTKSLGKIRREFNLDLSSVTDLSEALVKKNESLNVYEKKITMHESRFYRGLSERVESEHVVSRDEIVSFWSIMWNKNDDTVTYNDYLIPFVSDNHPTTFPSLDEFVNIINWLPNWKAAGIECIYNFFIKKLTTLHKYNYDIVKFICLEETPQADWFYCGLTYLIPKGIPRRGSDYRPITCMSNLYKLTTKCVTKVVQLEVEKRGLLAQNQLGAGRGVQGAKEQALLNIALNKGYGNNLKATWIDVKKLMIQ